VEAGREALAGTPLISIVMPTFDPREPHIREAIESVRSQRFDGWELCVADDGSRVPHVRRVLEQAAAEDDRVRVDLAERNSGISAATNRALGMSHGEYVAFLDHDDALAPGALEAVAAALQSDPSPDILYTDQDKLDRRGRRVAPFYKPDWSPVYVLGAMYIGHLLVARASLVREAGGLDSSFDGIQDFELLLRMSERSDLIAHLPRVLYHWRAAPGSIAAGTEEKGGIPELQARAVSEHLRRCGVPARAEPNPAIPHRACLAADPHRERPPVSVVLAPGEDRADRDRCLESLRRAAYPKREVIVAESSAPGHVSAALNAAAARSAAELLVFVAPYAELPDPGWLDALQVQAEVPGVGAVAPLSLFPDGRVAESGLTARRWDASGRVTPSEWWHGTAPVEPIMRGADGDADGYYGSLSCAREVAAASASCLLVSRQAFDRAGGFNEEYRTGHHDIDLCLRIRRLGLAVVVTPRARAIIHADPAGRPEDVVDRAMLVDTWIEELDRGDPYLNPNLSFDMAPLEGPRTGLLPRIARQA
jgi:O-antigen biosynthesis protein